MRTFWGRLTEYLRTHRVVAALMAITLGATYGLLMRMALEAEIMTISFIFLVPLAIGYLSVWYSPEEWRAKWWYALLLPWLAGALFLCGALLTNFEGLICVVFISPVVALIGSVGGLCARFFARYTSRTSASQSSLLLACFALFPFAFLPLEHTISGAAGTGTIKTVHSQIRIHAPKAVVWRNITRVPAIQIHEQTPSFFHAIGFPKPIEATLSHEGIGGVRNARFEKSVVFTETITEWQEQERLSFSIKANTDSIPPSSLDEHVTIGGKYFDILNGTYRIEEQGSDVVLHLSSEQRLSTTFNVYAGLWTGAIMQDIQSNILNVIQRRCETER